MASQFRCIECAHVGDVLEGMRCCPACGTRGVPANPAHDANWELSRWQWRLLLTAARLWSEQYHAESPGMGTFIRRMWRLILDEAPETDPLYLVVRLAAGVRAGSERQEQVIARFTPHELRCLTIWGANYVERCEESDALIPDSEFEPLLERLRKQQEPGRRFALTFRDEIDELREAGYDVEVREVERRFEGEDGG